MRETQIGGTEDRIPADCNFDKKAAIDYLGELSVIVYYNNARFQQNEFGEWKIER